MIRFTQVNDIKVGVVEGVPGETSDCVVRAFAASTGKPYQEAHQFVATHLGRRPRQGTNTHRIIKCLNDGFALGVKFEAVGDRKTVYYEGGQSYIAIAPGTTYRAGNKVFNRAMTLYTFLKEYPKGSYFVLVRAHAFAVVDGVIIGNYQDAKKLRTRLNGVYKVVE
jgi:hypothetical protein